jgi:CRP-like cAMP-binding protein
VPFHRATLLALYGGMVERMQDFFSGIPLLKDVAPTLLQMLETRGFEQGEKLITKGDEPTHVLIIRSGSVLVEVNGVRLVTRKQNEVIGEQAFINQKPHSADCIALSPVQAICISKKDARTFLRDPAFVENLLRELSDKLRESTNERYVRYGTEQRLFSEFRSHLSREVRDKLLDDRTDYGAPQQIENVVILFADIRGFTSYVHEAGPKNSTRVADELSRYFAAITEVHRRRRDGLMGLPRHRAVSQRRHHEVLRRDDHDCQPTYLWRQPSANRDRYRSGNMLHGKPWK